MQTPDLGPLVRGIIVVIGIAIALGQYPKLERWAKLQAIGAIEWKQGLPYFFDTPRARVKHQPASLCK
jgi:hypothetical protein